MTIEITCVADTQSGVGEGAVWDMGAQCLCWVDIPAGLIHRYDPATGENTSVAFGEPVGCLFVIELDFLKGREKLGDVPVHSLIRY